MNAMDDPFSPAPFTIAAPRLFDGTALRGPAWVTIASGHIAEVSFSGAAPAGTVALPEDAILAPGFIDIQVNGGGGVLLNDAPTEAGIRRIAAAHRRYGTTGLLPTLITDRVDVMEALASSAPAAMQVPGVLGFHLEGPALNKARKGIHLEAEIRAPDARDLAAIKSFAGCGRSLVTLAPECLPPTLIGELVDAGLRVAAGHSDATAAQIAQAADRGMTGVTHLFNAMSQLSARAPGVVGAALDDNRLFAGMICDGLHVDPLSLRLAFRCKGPDRLMLVTDAMALVGTEQRDFLLQGRRITLDGGRLTGPDGTLAGAHLTMMDAVHNAVEWLGIDLSDALAMASRTPAMFLGLGRELGAIGRGCRADLVAFNSRFEVVETWVGGHSSQRSSQAAASQQREVPS
ncbi:N-acetylglucosamine-6-phosphate deacetylase [Bradyrhizobium sp. Tv2a-2]|uniref:N-acetylglucosamine-6-phosphate deacetylase n=1 Tax=Bradyrhizobium sp. Tv2a-2 TaxID=113395 RepID=UPI0004199114|nr:N-acetylglucosamine-6-phosphate deacetylase [Bradyrhizobium sp. Tv2a-2]